MRNWQPDIFIKVEHLYLRPLNAEHRGQGIQKFELRGAGRGNDSCSPPPCIALQRETAACSAAARPREALSSYTLMTIGQSQHVGKRSTHDHLARLRWNSTRFEQRVVLIHDRLDSIQTVIRPEDNLHKRARVTIKLLCLPLRALPFCVRPPKDFLEIRKSRSEEHTSELQSRENLVCRLLLEKKK